MIPKEKCLILDGPIGTELIARGFQASSVLWTGKAAVDAPDLLRSVYADYLAAGANILTANTFRTNPYSAAKDGLSVQEARQLTHTSVAIATEAIEIFQDAGAGNTGPHFVAGSFGPLEDCYQPRLAPDLSTLERIHSQMAEWLVETGCDLAIAETMGTAREALTIVRASRRAGLSAINVSFITDETGKTLLGGDPLFETARACVEAGAEGILVNCVHSEAIDVAMTELRPLHEFGIVLGAYPNASRMRRTPVGTVEWEPNTLSQEESIAQFLSHAERWLHQDGARILGSCCGTGPAFIKALARKIRSV